jgi:hypothetical protein
MLTVIVDQDSRAQARRECVTNAPQRLRKRLRERLRKRLRKRLLRKRLPKVASVLQLDRYTLILACIIVYVHAYCIAQHIAPLITMMCGSWLCRMTDHTNGRTTRSKRGSKGGKRRSARQQGVVSPC